MTALLSRLVLIALFFSFCAAPAEAQTQEQEPEAPFGGPLAGVQVMQLSIAPLSDESARCGVQANSIRTIFEQPLTASGIVMQKSAHFRAIVKVTTGIYQENICISNIEASVVQTTRYFDRKTRRERAGQVLMWSQSRLLVSGQPEHLVMTNTGARELARSFIQRWQIDQ